MPGTGLGTPSGTLRRAPHQPCPDLRDDGATTVTDDRKRVLSARPWSRSTDPCWFDQPPLESGGALTAPGGDRRVLPEFEAPPVVEVALGVQFRPIFGLRAIELATLRDRWRTEYPLVQEQPPLPPAMESLSGSASVQFVLGPALQTRLWFLDENQSELVQLQHDRLTVNWRQATPETVYPRYEHVRAVFDARFADLRSFTDEAELGSIDVLQVEVNYVNAIQMEANQLGRLDRVMRHWRPPHVGVLGDPEQARAALVFAVHDVGSPPVRLYVAADPAQGPDGRPVVFLTLTVRGAPTAATAESALRFMDQAHDLVVKSFTELTPVAMHTKWGIHP